MQHLQNAYATDAIANHRFLKARQHTVNGFSSIFHWYVNRKSQVWTWIYRVWNSPICNPQFLENGGRSESGIFSTQPFFANALSEPTVTRGPFWRPPWNADLNASRRRAWILRNLLDVQRKIKQMNDNLDKSSVFLWKLQDFNENLWKSLVFPRKIIDLNENL